jgi:hypothetical protein
MAPINDGCNTIFQDAVAMAAFKGLWQSDIAKVIRAALEATPDFFYPESVHFFYAQDNSDAGFFRYDVMADQDRADWERCDREWQI